MKGLSIQPFASVRQRGKHFVARMPTDLLAVAGFVIIATVLLTAGVVSSLLVRAVIGFPLLFFVPGYVTVSTLFPRVSSGQGSTGLSRLVGLGNHTVTDVERAALSFGLSLALLPLLGLGIALTPWGFTRSIVVSTVACFALIGVGLATARRLSVPPTERYRTRIGRRFAAARARMFGGGSVGSIAVNLALVLSVLLAVTTVGYGLVVPQDGERYTSLQLLTEDENGDLVASGFPSEIESGDSLSFVVGIENQEDEESQYTVVVQEQRFEDGELSGRTELRRLDYTVADNETTYEDLSITPVADEGTVRIAVLLYEGEVPETPTTDTAYRSGYFWTDVTDDDTFVDG